MAARVVIIGAGFAGLTLARRLDGSNYQVLLIDRYNHHQFQPLLYQVAMAGLEPSSISFPLRAIFQRSPNVRVRMAEVLQVMPEQQQISTTAGTVDYDVLVVCGGATTNFFGNERLRQHAMTLKSTADAIALRQHLLLMLEKAAIAGGNEVQDMLTLAVAGGGPTGVELAGALAEFRRHVLWKDFPELDASRMRVVLVEAGDRLLAAMSHRSSAAALKYLTQMGVELRLNTRVADYDGRHIVFADGSRLACRTLIWTAGITAVRLPGLDGGPAAPGNRIRVDAYCRMEGYPNIYIAGDLAYRETEQFPKGLPQIAPVAIAQAKNIAENLLRAGKGRAPKAFHYRHRGTMATVGKHKAVVEIAALRLQGWPAWYVWMAVHLISLMGMKNRLFVFINWVIAYFTNDSTLRLIFEPMRRANGRG